jgi:hypothetical protein
MNQTLAYSRQVILITKVIRRRHVPISHCYHLRELSTFNANSVDRSFFHSRTFVEIFNKSSRKLFEFISFYKVRLNYVMHNYIDYLTNAASHRLNTA